MCPIFANWYKLSRRGTASIGARRQQSEFINREIMDAVPLPIVGYF